MTTQQLIDLIRDRSRMLDATLPGIANQLRDLSLLVCLLAERQIQEVPEGKRPRRKEPDGS